MNNEMTEKVRHLLNKAEATENQHEADAFFAKAAELIHKYRIDAADLEALTGVQDRGQIVQEEFFIHGTMSLTNVHIYNTVAINNDCQLIMTEQRNTSDIKVTLIGYQSDVDNVMLLGTSLHLTAVSQAKKHLKEMRQKGNRAKAFYIQRSFIIGFCNELSERFARQKVDSEIARPTMPSTALVIVDRRKAVDEFFRSEHANTVIRRSRAKYGSAESSEAGRREGARADIGNARLKGQGQLR